MPLSPCKHPPLPNKPGTNYIEQTGGLPHFIDCVARAIFHTGRSQGDVSKAVKFAIGRSEDWAAGKGNVSASTRAQAAAAVAQLKAQGAASKAKTAAKNLSDCGCGNLDLSQRLGEVIDLAYDEAKHPRSPMGRWIAKVANLKVGDTAHLGDGHSVTRLDGSRYEVRGPKHVHAMNRQGSIVKTHLATVSNPGHAAVLAYNRKGPAPKRVNSRAMTLTSDLEQRVIDLTERLTA